MKSESQVRGATTSLLELVQRLPTSGARAVEPFTHAGNHYLAVPQLAQDIPGAPAQMTGGDSNVETLVYRWRDGAFVEHQRLPVPGGEDAEFFCISGRAFLAVASLRSGAGPYEMNVQSILYELRDGRLEPLQSFPTFAAKQWRHFSIGARHFLALAQGVVIEGVTSSHAAPSRIYEWNGSEFIPFQDVKSAWGYNWAFAAVGGQLLLAYADHVERSRLLRWSGSAFEDFQELDGGSGRAFCFFETGGESWLAFANLLHDSLIYRWADGRFVLHQRLCGPGGREFAWIESPDGGHLALVNFLHGSREAPQTALQSCFYRYLDGQFGVVEQFPTFGGTDLAAFEIDGRKYLAVANSLSAEVRFRTDSKIYRLARL